MTQAEDTHHGLYEFSDDLIDLFEEYAELDQSYREQLRQTIADRVGEKLAWLGAMHHEQLKSEKIAVLEQLVDGFDRDKHEGVSFEVIDDMIASIKNPTYYGMDFPYQGGKKGGA